MILYQLLNNYDIFNNIIIHINYIVFIRILNTTKHFIELDNNLYWYELCKQFKGVFFWNLAQNRSIDLYNIKCNPELSWKKQLFQLLYYEENVNDDCKTNEFYYSIWIQNEINKNNIDIAINMIKQIVPIIKLKLQQFAHLPNIYNSILEILNYNNNSKYFIKKKLELFNILFIPNTHKSLSEFISSFHYNVY